MFGLRDPWRAVRYAALIALIVVAIPRLASWLPFTAPFAHPEQDACTFGPVSNAEYRTMLAKARSLQRWTWLGSPPEDDLLKQFLELSGGSSSPYLKIAAIHAVLRAMGAEFRNNGERGADMFERVSRTGGTISYQYALAVPRIGVMALPGDAWLIAALQGPPHGPYEERSLRHRKGLVYFVAHFPNPIDPIPAGVLWTGKHTCPPVPPPELESLFSG